MEGKEWGSGGTDVRCLSILILMPFLPLKYIFKYFIIFLLCPCIHVYVHMRGHVGAHGRQKKVLSSLELELQAL